MMPPSMLLAYVYSVACSARPLECSAAACKHAAAGVPGAHVNAMGAAYSAA
jgi:hypothetical protein